MEVNASESFYCHIRYWLPLLYGSMLLMVLLLLLLLPLLLLVLLLRTVHSIGGRAGGWASCSPCTHTLAYAFSIQLTSFFIIDISRLNDNNRYKIDR